MTSTTDPRLVVDQSISPNTTLDVSFANIRAQIAGLQSSALIRPQTYGLVPNSPAAAAANRAALQNWLNAADQGVLFQNPRDIYYVATGTTPIYIRKKVTAPFLRLAPVVQGGAGQTFLEFSPTFGTPIPLRIGQAIVRDQSTVTLANPSALPVVGSTYLVQAGQDAYTPLQCGWQQLAKVLAVDSSGANALTPLVTLDIAAPRGFAAPTPVSGATAQLVPVTSGAGDGSQINFMEIEQIAQTLTLSKAIRFYACKNVRIINLAAQGARGELLAFDVASEGNTVDCYHNFKPANRLGGSALFCRDFGNCVDRIKSEVFGPHTQIVQTAYSVGAKVERSLLHQYGLSVYSTGLYESFQESSSLQIGSIDVKVDSDAASPSAGFILAAQATGGQAPQVNICVINKDFYRLGCLPNYIRSKSVEGKLSILEREFKFGPGAVTEDYFLARMFLARVEFFTPDFTGWSAYLYTPPFNASGGGTDSLAYKGGAAEVAGNESAVNDWNAWMTEGYTDYEYASVANGSRFNNSAASTERWLRYVGTAGEAGNYIRLQLFGYPMKAVYVRQDS